MHATDSTTFWIFLFTKTWCVLYFPPQRVGDNGWLIQGHFDWWEFVVALDSASEATRNHECGTAKWNHAVHECEGPHLHADF